MVKFKGSLGRTFVIRRTVDEVAATMTDPSVFHRFILGLERFEAKEDGTYRFSLYEKREKGVRFKGDYCVRYDVEPGRSMRWHTVGPSNMTTEGRVRFAQQGTTTDVSYEETIVCDMDINPLIGRIIRPIVKREISKGVSTFLDRVREHLET
jgi:carbon monoxide dehydrogenase subunit G